MMKRKKGFTIVELLTVMAVIAVLIGLLVPALALVKDHAKRLQQKAQFHAIGVGVELYKSEFGSYPPSNDNAVNTQSSPENAYDPAPYCGSNKLAEAMVGLDFLGLPPNSEFHPNGDNSSGTVVYDTTPADIKSRKGPYMELETANAFAMYEVYGTSNANFPGSFADDTAPFPSLVLCDVYAKKRSGVNGKKTGTPILYYRARTQYVEQDLNGFPHDDDGQGLAYTEADNDIYFYQDNDSLLSLGMPDDGVAYTMYDATLGIAQQNFEDMIRNEQVTAVLKPYRADSFILISAGKDGDFGTGDDVFNFDKEIIE